MHKSFMYNNATISYSVYGKGAPVVLLHGFAEDYTIWNNQIAFLQDHCQLIIPDLPGSGKSEMLPGENIRIEDYADCIYRLLQNEEIDNCVMLGHSMGGYITLAFAEKYSSELNGFGLVHSTAFADNEEKKAARKKGIKLIEEYGAFPFIKNTTPNLFADKFKQEHPHVIAELIDRGKDFTSKALIRYYTAMMNRGDRIEVLKKSEVPVLFIIGSEDVAAPLQDLLQQVHLPKISHIHIIEGVGHMSMLEAANRLNEHLRAFIKEIKSQ